MMNIKRTAEDAAADARRFAMGEQGDKAKDILGRVYEYFLLHYVRMERLSNETLPVQEWRYFIRKRCPCVLPVQFRRSAGAFTRARSGEG
jgi:hypothetical protein